MCAIAHNRLQQHSQLFLREIPSHLGYEVIDILEQKLVILFVAIGVTGHRQRD
jgi:hypothetical protein